MERELYKKHKVQNLGVSFEDWKYGLQEESEHDDITGGDIELTARIALAHFREDNQYYNYLKEAMQKMKRDKKITYDMAKGVWSEIYVLHSGVDFVSPEEIAEDISGFTRFSKRKYLTDALLNYLNDPDLAQQTWAVIITLLE